MGYGYENRMNDKRKSFNQDNDNNQGGGKFRRPQDFGNRAPFKGNQNKPFNKGNWGRDNSFNRNNNKQSFNRGNNNSFNKGYNNRQNFGGQRKSWQNKNNHNNDRPLNEDVSLQNENKTINENSKDEMNKKADVSTTNGMEEPTSSESEQETVTKNNIISQNDSETSESEEEVVLEEINKSLMNPADSSESSDAEEEHEVIKMNHNENKSEGNNGNDDHSEATSESEEEIDINAMEVSQIQDSPNKSNFNGIDCVEDTIRVSEIPEEQRNCIILVKSVPTFMNSNHLEAFFSRYGKIQFIKRLGKQISRNFCICYEKPDDAQKALEVDGMEYMESVIIVKKCLETPSLHERDFTNAVYVGNIADDMFKTKILRQAFNHCGIIKDVFPCKFRNYAFIWFDSEDAVELALAMDKTLLGDRLIYVQMVDTEKIKREFTRPSSEFKNHRYSFNKSPRFQNRSMEYRRYKEGSVRSGFISKRR
ncbi:hypothetical protein ILUMI_04800 [Ignelater luminosus]|uniref:RRM domain-containing protein n=1 Tax=Ignelater luminosus TaxID=2038154 RepID=A0A8K0D8Z3_IGNLU|nr:hypothetical protein ILUMI_04800 [Ignelater luminosus]